MWTDFASGMKHSNGTTVGRDVRYWHKADISDSPVRVRFRRAKADMTICGANVLTPSGQLKGEMFQFPPHTIAPVSTRNRSHRSSERF
jgi:hypothetical protein